MRTLILKGTPRQMGESFGEACREQIRDFYELRMTNAIVQARLYGGRLVDEPNLRHASRQCLPIVRAYHREGVEELEGIAAGSGLRVERIWAMNALTDLRDLAAFSTIVGPDGEGCSSAVVADAAAANGQGFCGQTWDLSTDNMPYVLMVRRQPVEGPETLCLTTTGCLSLVGMNAHGVAVGTTNIRATDVRLGVGYLDVIHKALTAPDAAGAWAAIVGAPRAAAHYFYVMDSQGAAQGIECTAEQYAEVDVAARGTYVHCNHFLEASVRGLEVSGTPMVSSLFRQSRLETLVREAPSAMEPADLKRFLSDTEGAANAISRHDFAGISSNGAVVMMPFERALWAVHGPPDAGTWTRFSL